MALFAVTLTAAGQQKAPLLYQSRPQHFDAPEQAFRAIVLLRRSYFCCSTWTGKRSNQLKANCPEQFQCDALEAATGIG
jgi:hypothetical protein